MEPIEISKWDARFLQLAHHVSQWSKDPSTKVGAVIVDPERRVVGMGYNGFPRGVLDSPDRLKERNIKYELVVHAEVNAIMSAVASVKGCTLYTTPIPTCSRCAGIVIQAGITNVVSIMKPDSNVAWGASINWAAQMYNEAKVGFMIYTPEVLSA